MLWTDRSYRFEILLLVIVFALFVAGCEENLPPLQPGPSDIINDEEEIRRYFPMNVGDYYRYYVNTGIEVEYETVDVQEHLGGPAATIELSRQGLTSTEYKRWSGPNLLASMSSEFVDEQKELAGPFYDGAQWRQVNDSSDNYIYYIDCEILDLRYPLTVEAGSFETMLVQQINHTENPPFPATVDTFYFFYSADVGIVKKDLNGIVYDLIIFIPGAGYTTMSEE